MHTTPTSLKYSIGRQTIGDHESKELTIDVCICELIPCNSLKTFSVYASERL